MSCKQCKHYHIYQMITNGRPYGYTGYIPCENCSRFSKREDNFEPVQVQQKDSTDDEKLLCGHSKKYIVYGSYGIYCGVCGCSTGKIYIHSNLEKFSGEENA